MSNLKLPSLEYANLLKLANAGESWVKIGYQTWVRRNSEHSVRVDIRHHDTTIATVNATVVVVSHRNYHTSTTANRLNKIVFENCGFWVGIKDGRLELRFKEGKAIPLPDGQVLYTKNAHV